MSPTWPRSFLFQLASAGMFKRDTFMIKQITSIYCICFDLTQALEIQDDPQCKMNTAEVRVAIFYNELLIRQ